MTSVMVSWTLKWLLSHIRLERDMVRVWARLGSSVEKIFGVGSKEKENRMRRRRRRRRIRKKKNLHYPVAAVLGCCCMRWPDAHRLDYQAFQRAEKTRDWKLARYVEDFLLPGKIMQPRGGKVCI